MSVSDDRRGGGGRGQVSTFPEIRGWQGGVGGGCVLGFDGSLRGAGINAPRLKPPGWLHTEVRFWER